MFLTQDRSLRGAVSTTKEIVPMIAVAKPLANPRAAETSTDQDQAAWHTRFLELLPAIRRHARVAFRHLDAEAREESIAEAVAYAWTAFHRLAELGRLSLAFPSALAQFGVSRARDGRRVGCRSNVRDVSSTWCQRRKRIDIKSLDERDGDDGWREIAVEDRRCGPARIARFRIDFAAWMDSLPERQREIAEALAAGHETQLVASMFGLSSGRVSQLRKVLLQSWLCYQREPDSPRLAHPACA